MKDKTKKTIFGTIAAILGVAILGAVFYLTVPPFKSWVDKDILNRPPQIEQPLPDEEGNTDNEGGENTGNEDNGENEGAQGGENTGNEDNGENEGIDDPNGETPEDPNTPTEE